MTFDEMLEKILRLRDKSHGATVKFYDFLIRAESEHRSVWDGRYKKFTLFLTANKVCDARTFEAYRLARSALGVERARELGVEGAIKAHRSSKPAPAPRRNFAALESENVELRRRVKDLETENEDLRTRLAKAERATPKKKAA